MESDLLPCQLALLTRHPPSSPVVSDDVTAVVVAEATEAAKAEAATAVAGQGRAAPVEQAGLPR